MKPDVVQKIVANSRVFNQFFVEPKPLNTHTKDTKPNSFNNIIEYIDKVDVKIETTKNEQAFLIGFISNKKLSSKTLEDIYNNLFIPVFRNIADNVKPTNRIIIDEDFILKRHPLIRLGDPVLHLGEERRT
jgi:hypothetical protein